MASGQTPFTPPPPPPSGAGLPYGGEPPAPPTPGLEPIPWEDRERLGLVEALVENVKLFVSRPSEAFSRTRESGDLGSPILYAVIIGFFCAVVNQVWNIVVGRPLVRALLNFVPPGTRESLLPMLHPPPGSEIVQVILTPVFVLLGLFIGAAIFHLCLMLVGGLGQSRTGFEGTVRAVAYASVANLAAVVPVAGALFGGIWLIALEVIGLSTLHRTSRGKALAAVLIPIVLCCLCCGGALLAGGAWFAALFAHANR